VSWRFGFERGARDVGETGWRDGSEVAGGLKMGRNVTMLIPCGISMTYVPTDSGVLVRYDCWV
jgi:hypothetical protein